MVKKNQGVSLIEILVSCVIIALLVGGLGSVFVAGSRWITQIHSQSAAEEIGKLFLDPMQMHVRRSDWDVAIPGSNALTIGTTWCDGAGGHAQNPLCPVSRRVGKIDYNVRYDVQNAPASNAVRKVTVTITWQEPEIR